MRAQQDGFLLIEVMMSALIVALMVVATFSGFSALSHKSAEQRAVDEAAQLAAQSQQQMRSDPVSVLLAFKEGENVYASTVAGTNFTIEQKASFGNGSSQTGCAATETTKGQGTYILISSKITWPRMVVKPVEESSLITPPTGSALDVEASNGEVPTSGVPVVIKYVPAGSTSTNSLEGTTGPAGCVLFAGIPATEAKVEVKEAPGIVNRHGTQSWPTETVTLAPNVLTHHALKLAHGGSLIAEFTYEKGTKDVHKNNAGTGNVEEPVTGDTFVAFNSEMELPPNFEEASTIAPEPFGGALFEIIPGKPGDYEQTAPSPTEIVKFPQGDLFPFPSPKNWSAWAGDCVENKPETFDSSIKPEAKTVPPGASAPIRVETTYVILNVYAKSQAEVETMKSHGEPTWTALEMSEAKLVTIKDKRCSGVTPDNEDPVNIEHTQYTTTNTEWGGHLSAPFQPFGEYELCLEGGEKGVGYGRVYRPKKPYINENPSKPVTLNLYLNELSQTEKQEKRKEEELAAQKAREAKETEARTKREALEHEAEKSRIAGETETRTKREASEKETKAKREASEAASKKEREKEETTQKETKTKEEATKTERLAKEKAEKETWESEVSKNKNSKLTKEKEDKEKEEAQATKRKTAEAAEKTAREKRESEEKATQTKRKEEEEAKKAAETKETKEKSEAETKETEKRKAAETKEAETRTAAETKETETRKSEEKKAEEAKVAAEAAETTELSNRAQIVETKKTC